MPIVNTKEVVKSYQMGEVRVDALKGVSVAFEKGEYVAIMGPSGSGKSTYLNLLGCLDSPSSGTYHLDDIDVSSLSDDDLSEVRRKKIGFVFQSFNLIHELSVLENIEVPLFYEGAPEDESRERAAKLAEMVGLGHRLKHQPRELSGGEQQRVAVARAMANDPVIILADEPTGNLDSKNGEQILRLLDDLHERGKTLIMVTHDPNLARRTERVVRFKDGQLVSDRDERDLPRQSEEQYS
jgi:putative ABC transport system ATP-binding protein